MMMKYHKIGVMCFVEALEFLFCFFCAAPRSLTHREVTRRSFCSHSQPQLPTLKEGQHTSDYLAGATGGENNQSPPYNQASHEGSGSHALDGVGVATVSGRVQRPPFSLCGFMEKEILSSCGDRHWSGIANDHSTVFLLFSRSTLLSPPPSPPACGPHRGGNTFLFFLPSLDEVSFTATPSVHILEKVCWKCAPSKCTFAEGTLSLVPL